MFVLLYDDKRLIGYLCLFPIKDSLYEQISCTDKHFDSDIPPEMLEEFYEQEKPLQDIFAALPIDTEEALDIIEKKYPILKKANSYIVVFGYHHKRKNFQKAKLSKPCCYIGEFDIEVPEPDTDGKKDKKITKISIEKAAK